MQRRLYKELWKRRFNKMLALEKNSVKEYEALLRKCLTGNKNHPVGPSLERLIRDEKKHIRLVRELTRILERQIV